MSLLDLFDNFTAKPVTCTWVIENFLERMRNNGSQKVMSPEMKLSFGAFNLKIAFLKSDFIFLHGFAFISFAARDKIPELYYRISVIDKEGQKWKTKEGAVNGFAYYICVFDLFLVDSDNLLPDGKLTIYCEIFEHSNDPCLNNLVSLSHDNQSLLDSSKLSDVVLVVGEREFKAHKVILSARSEVFEKMFEHDMEESKRNRVEIEDMSAAAVEELLNFIYTGKVKDLDEHVHELYAAADKYQIDSLKSYCELYLAKSLSVSSVPKTLQLAELYSLRDLKSKCIHYITRHATEFKFDDWKELTSNHLESMYKVFQIHGRKFK